MKIPEEKYKYIIESLPISCVDLILVENKKVLLGKRKNRPVANQWWFPGGRIHKNEKMEDAVKRKAKEELGAEVEIIKMLGAYDTFFEDSVFSDSEGTHTINITFIVKPKDKNQKIKIDGSHSELKWISNIEKNLPEYVKRILQESKIFS